jgi:hypothetical protein
VIRRRPVAIAQALAHAQMQASTVPPAGNKPAP